MRKRPNDVIVWDMEGSLTIDLPKGIHLYTLSDGTLRALIPTPAGEPAMASIVNCIGVPITKIVSVPHKEKT
jgi:hypothetical protein